MVWHLPRNKNNSSPPSLSAAEIIRQTADHTRKTEAVKISRDLAYRIAELLELIDDPWDVDNEVWAATTRVKEAITTRYTPAKPTTIPDEPTVWTPTPEQWEAYKNRCLSALGLTYDELRRQAATGRYSSIEARHLWVVIGEQDNRITYGEDESH